MGKWGIRLLILCCRGISDCNHIFTNPCSLVYPTTCQFQLLSFIHLWMLCVSIPHFPSASITPPHPTPFSPTDASGINSWYSWLGSSWTEWLFAGLKSLNHSHTEKEAQTCIVRRHIERINSICWHSQGFMWFERSEIWRTDTTGTHCRVTAWHKNCKIWEMAGLLLYKLKPRLG